MTMLCDRHNCTSCGACAAVCPVKAISMERDDQGAYYPHVQDNCIHCYKCERACPVLSPIEPAGAIWPKAYVVKNSDREALKKSASGGVFALLAQWAFQKGGWIYGAAWTKELHVEILPAENPQQIAGMHGSKYVYSHSCQAYLHAAQQLKEGRTVVFTGLPCQIAALYGVLGGKDLSNLYTVEIVCHGAGSEAVFDAYLEQQKQQRGTALWGINHTCKKRPWTNLIRKYLEYRWADGTVTYGDYSRDSYLSLYMHSICLNQVCYECPFAKVPRKADITIGDFMGYGVVKQRKTPGKDGVSALWANTRKGAQLVEELQKAGKSLWEECSLEECMIFNHGLWKPAAQPAARKAFFQDFKTMSYDQLAKQYAGGWKYLLLNGVKQGICKVLGANFVAWGMYQNYRRHKIPQQVDATLESLKETISGCDSSSQ